MPLSCAVLGLIAYGIIEHGGTAEDQVLSPFFLWVPGNWAIMAAGVLVQKLPMDAHY